MHAFTFMHGDQQRITVTLNCVTANSFAFVPDLYSVSLSKSHHQTKHASTTTMTKKEITPGENMLTMQQTV